MSLLTPPERVGGKTPGRTPGCEITSVSLARGQLSRSSWSRACFPLLFFSFPTLFSPAYPPLSFLLSGGREKRITVEAREQREESVIKRTILQQFRLFM